MTENTKSYDPERQRARLIALEAAELVQQWYERGFEVEWKGEDDPVTEADRGANDLILERLKTHFPGDAVLSEESHDDLSRLDADRLWVVDPLDGTKDFVNRTGDFAVMIGLVAQGLPVAGAVCRPGPGHLWHAAKGEGATLEAGGQSRPLEVSTTEDTAQMRLVVTRSHRFALLDEMVNILGITEERPLGSVGLKVGAIASAEADLYVHLSVGTKEWDTCAPAIILEEAGGAITDAFGKPLAYNQREVMRRRGVVASNGVAHRQVIELLAPLADKTFGGGG